MGSDIIPTIANKMTAKAMNWSFTSGVEQVLPNERLFGIPQRWLCNSIHQLSIILFTTTAEILARSLIG